MLLSDNVDGMRSFGDFFGGGGGWSLNRVGGDGENGEASEGVFCLCLFFAAQ
jgi:hypothetical protein